MSQISVVFLVVLGGILLVPVAERLRLPAPVLTTIFGLLLALLPFIPDLRLTPELILPVLLPPLLYAAARRSSWRQFADNLKPILVLAVVLVFVTAAAVAVLAATLHPMLPLGAAVVLGAITSPPDVAAVTTIAARLGLPRRLVTVMEGEGLFNDVTALTLYQVAVAGVVAGTLSILDTIGAFVFSGVAAVAIGLAVGFAAKLCFDRIDDSRLTTGLSLLVPYVAYIPADELHASGVLAVLTAAFYMNARSADPDDIEGRLVRGSFWEVIELMVTAVTFGLVGMELVTVLRQIGPEAAALVWQALIIAFGVIVVRAVWMIAAMWLTRWHMVWTGQRIDWRVTVVMAWSGMRGVVTIVTAMALPATIASGAAFPGRDQILFVAMVVVLITLLVQGLTLPYLIDKIGLRADAAAEARSLRAVVTVAQEAAASRLEELKAAGEVAPELADRLRGWFAAWTADAAEPPDASEDTEKAQRQALRRQIHTCEVELLSAARASLIAARSRPGFDPASVDAVMRKLDQHSTGRH